MISEKTLNFNEAIKWTNTSFVISILNIAVSVVNGYLLLTDTVVLLYKVWAVAALIASVVTAYFFMSNIRKIDKFQQPSKIAYYIVFVQSLIGIVVALNTLSILQDLSFFLTELEEDTGLESAIIVGIFSVIVVLGMHAVSFVKTLRLEKYRESENE